jgi:hypothetical protein
MENGKDYKNFPEQNYVDASTNHLVPTFERSKTIPNLKNQNKFPSTPNIKEKNFSKLSQDAQKLILENHERIQRTEYQNRKKQIDLIGPKQDIQLLNIKYTELENSYGARPNLKQNIKDHVNTLYDQESKYLGERAELYKTKVYKPYLLKQYIESVKVDPKVSAFDSNGAAWHTQNNVYVEDQTDGVYRPKLFADKVFNDYSNLKRTPLENQLLYSNASAHPKIQEDGFVLQQSTYGGSYNTKKFLQENEMVSNEETIYARLDEGELNAQNVVLKLAIEKLALSNFRNGLAQRPDDFEKAYEMINKAEKESKEAFEYPRCKGPIPPELYETLYCANEISEMSDGYSKRFYHRLYDSPNLVPHARFKPLNSDIQQLNEFNEKSKREQIEKEEEQRRLVNEYRKNLPQTEFTINENNKKVARRSLDKISKLEREDRHRHSIYTTSYLPYYYENEKRCPPNEFYKNIHYAQSPSGEVRLNNTKLPAHLISLQDGWSKSLANKRFNSAYQTKLVDLRENHAQGKKILHDSPMIAARYA